MTIKNKKDFEDKYIILPSNTSRKKFNKIKKKLKRLGFNTENGYLGYEELANYGERYLLVWKGGDIGNWDEDSAADQIKNKQEISIKEFLKEDKVENFKVDIKGIVLNDDGLYVRGRLKPNFDGYNCIPSKCMVFYGTSLREIKEDVDRAIQGFSYKKATTMKLKDAVKEGKQFKRKVEIIYDAGCQQIHRISNHTISELGYPTRIELKEYEISDLIINSDEMVEIVEPKKKK